ncbi:MAG: tRNA (adenosine(37)-N6)-threonylcarbamoyltransferase complex dimerization subunit type 1 TsaB [Rhodoluna sp.]|nr:tRNA (adenosine(37)-N6)-threonylcarbamoyltransferase complex dimerization subunit type 1 TsaB [Rhodoluna sp.]
MKQIVLALDTSQGTSVAVLVDGKVLAESADPNPMRHAENIGTLIASCIEKAGVSSAEVTDVAVGIGPGPFTGLRVGIAAAKMFAAGSKARLHGVGSLDAIAFKLPLTEPKLVVADARRSEVYFGLYQGKSPNGVPKALLVPGVSKQAELEARLQAQGQEYELISEPVAAAAVGLLALAQQSEGSSAGPIQANYLREPDATYANPTKVSG